MLGEQGKSVTTYTEVLCIDQNLRGKLCSLEAATCLDCLQHAHLHVHSDLVPTEWMHHWAHAILIAQLL